MSVFLRFRRLGWRRAPLAALGLSAAGGLLAAAVLPQAAHAQQTASPSGLWQEADDKPLLAARGNVSAAAARRGVVPAEYRTLRLDVPKLAGLLAAAPREFAAARRAVAAVAATSASADPASAIAVAAPVASTEIDLPLPHSARFVRFTVEESPIMEDGLAARYPELRTYIAQGIDNPALTARLDLTPQGFHAIIFSPAGQIYIDPYFSDGSDLSTAIAYYKRDYAAAKPFQCLVPPDPAAQSEEVAERAARAELAKPTGASLRTYRLAVATTGEYTTKVCNGTPTVAGGLSAVVTTVNRVTALYERDFAIRLKLIDNEDKIIYTNSSTDPYTNTNANSLLSQNQTNLDKTTVVGAANYDIGHVFSTAGGGLAGLGVVCKAGSKAQGETGTTNPTGDPYDIDYVAHEMGHQFGANHTFNSSTGSCNTNGNANTAYEPGSGVTVMAYAGICTETSSNVQDLAPHSDDFFHTASYDEIDAYTSKAPASTGAVATATGNNAPTVAVPGSYTIPIGTPFALTAAGADADNDRLTYCWEELDRGAYVNSTTIAGLDNGASPIFRSYPPTTNPTRLFPSLAYILNNANVPPLRNGDGYLTGEALPSKARAAFNFRCTVRDNRAGGGGSNYGLTTLVVSAAAGPFAVTAPNSAATLAGGSAQTVTWSVANTSAAPVSCANVKISLSADGGLTFPFVLADSVPNTGTAVVTLPNVGNVATKQGRIKVEAVGNIFFDINDANLTITSTNAPPAFAANSGGITVVRGTPSPVSATVGTATPGSNALTGVTVSNAPDGVTVTGAVVNGNAVQLSAQAECRVTTTLTARIYPINVTVTDASGAAASGTVNLMVMPNPAPTLGDYTAASVGQGGSATVNPSSGPVDTNFNLLANPFSVLVVSPPAGLSLAVNQVTGAVTATAASSTPTGAVSVRVTLQDACGAAVVKIFSLTVTPPVNSAPVFTNAAPPSAATAGTAYSYQFTANGTPAPTFSVTAGTLPPGLSLNANSGLLSGTPTTPGAYAGIQVTASNGVSPGAASQAFSISVSNTFGNYAATYGLNGANAAATADPDGDGVVNLLEYALNLNPAAPDAASAAPGDAQVRDYAGTKYLALRFVRVPTATDLTYIVESSANLTTWNAVATSAGGAAFSGAGVVADDASNTGAHGVEVRDTVPQDGTNGQKRFLRLRVVR